MNYMKTDKEIMVAFQEQFNTGRLFTESNVLVLMGMARGEERRRAQGTGRREEPENVCLACGHMNEENCNTCTLIGNRQPATGDRGRWMDGSVWIRR